MRVRPNPEPVYSERERLKSCERTRAANRPSWPCLWGVEGNRLRGAIAHWLGGGPMRGCEAGGGSHWRGPAGAGWCRVASRGRRCNGLCPRLSSPLRPPAHRPAPGSAGGGGGGSSGCGLREPGLDAAPHPRAPGAVPSPGGAGGPMEVRGGHRGRPPRPPGLGEGLEVTGGDGRGPGGGQTWRTAAVRRGRGAGGAGRRRGAPTGRARAGGAADGTGCRGRAAAAAAVFAPGGGGGGGRGGGRRGARGWARGRPGLREPRGRERGGPRGCPRRGFAIRRGERRGAVRLRPA